MEETVNKNIEKYQTPFWRGHPSLLGWCQMNYPAYLTDKRHKREPSPRDEVEDLSYIHQKRNTSAINDTKIYKPLTNTSKNKSVTRQEKVGSPPKGYKSSVYTLTTTPLENRKFLLSELHKDPNVSRVKPLASEIGHQDFKSKFSKKIMEVGEIKYHEEPDEEEMRHLKRLPNSILTEQSLKEMMGSDLLYLNLSNLKWVKNEHLNKLGFVSPNLEELNVSGTCANDLTLEEFGKTLLKLKALDVSNCQELTEKGITNFFENLQSNLQKFWAANCHKAVTDQSIRPFVLCEELASLNLEFCYQITDEALAGFIETASPLKEIYFSGCTKLTGKAIAKLIEVSRYQLEVAELSNMTQPEFDNETMKSVGSCHQLQRLNISGCSALADDALNNLLHGVKDLPPEDPSHKKEEGLKHLVEFRMSSLKANSEMLTMKFLTASHNIEILDLNGFLPLTETGLNMILKGLPSLKILLINYTQNIPDTYLVEMRQAHPEVKILRTIVANSDPKDNGLRVPFPKIQAGKKKKKKGKKK